MSVADRLARYHRGREPERLALKHARMATDPLAFFRGTPNLFFEDWSTGAPAGLETPMVWLCGDLHLENFGSYRGDNRCTYFDFNDFDEACLGPAAWDLARLLTSVAIEAGEREWRSKQTRELCESALESYAAALKTGKARWVERETAQGIIHGLFLTLTLRTGVTLLDRRTELHRRRRTIRKDGLKALPLASGRDPARLAALLKRTGEFRYLDAARRIAGNSSLGVPRFVLLVEDGDEEVFLLDLKQARPPVALQFCDEVRQPGFDSEAHRVVEIQGMVQAIPPAFLRPVEFDGAWWVMRELMPSEDRVEVAKASGRKFSEHVASLGQIVAWGHLRSGGRRGSATIDQLAHFGGQRSWRSKLSNYAVEYALRARRDWESFRKTYRPSEV